MSSPAYTGITSLKTPHHVELQALTIEPVEKSVLADIAVQASDDTELWRAQATKLYGDALDDTTWATIESDMLTEAVTLMEAEY
jgi:hypothetical protein